jgi:lysophospholipase L1-like esterase
VSVFALAAAGLPFLALLAALSFPVDGGARPGYRVEPRAAEAPGPADRRAPFPFHLQGPLVVPTPIEDPSGHALDAFHTALRRAAARKGQARIAWFGASHTAGDLYTGLIRRELQLRYGDAGHGFVLPAKPWNWYRHQDVNLDGTLRWRADRVGKSDAVRDGLYGLAGVSIASKRRRDFGQVRTTDEAPVGRTVSRFEVWFLRRPGGGSFDVRIDGRRVRRIRTAAGVTQPGYAEFKVRDAPHALEVRPVGDDEVRLFGVVMERKVPGVVLDTLGIPGTRAAQILEWDRDLFREHLSRRRPDLVVLAYGTNEAGDDEVPIGRYASDLREVLRRVREAAPGASCLLVGPSDRPLRLPDGGWDHRPRTARVNEVQRSVAAEAGCGFFDVVRFMGGDLSILRWVESDPPFAQADRVHFTRDGYEALGREILARLLPRR